MEISSQTIATLRDRITENTKAVQELSAQYEIANLLKLLELGLITKEDVLNNETYQNFSNQNKPKTKHFFK